MTDISPVVSRAEFDAVTARLAALEKALGDTTTAEPGLSVAYRLNRLEQVNPWLPPAVTAETGDKLEATRQEAVTAEPAAPATPSKGGG